MKREKFKFTKYLVLLFCLFVLFCLLPTRFPRCMVPSKKLQLCTWNVEQLYKRKLVHHYRHQFQSRLWARKERGDCTKQIITNWHDRQCHLVNHPMNFVLELQLLFQKMSPLVALTVILVTVDSVCSTKSPLRSITSSSVSKVGKNQSNWTACTSKIDQLIDRNRQWLRALAMLQTTGWVERMLCGMRMGERNGPQRRPFSWPARLLLGIFSAPSATSCPFT